MARCLQFGIFANPPKKMLEEVGLKDIKLPMIIIFFSTNGTAESVQGMPYQGGFNYEEMTATFEQVPTTQRARIHINLFLHQVESLALD